MNDSTDDPPAPSVDTVWEKFHLDLRKLTPDNFQYLRSGASEQQLLELEAILGTALPPDLRRSLSIHNGENLKAYEIGLYRFFLLDTASIAESWRMWMDIGSVEANSPNNFEDIAVSTEGWNPKWIPIAKSGNDYIVMDLAPGGAGTYGQVLQMYYNQPLAVEALSYREWLNLTLTNRILNREDLEFSQ